MVAIGGLTPARAQQALEAGASAVAVASGLALGDLEANAAAYAQACGLALEKPSGPGRARPWVLTGLPGSGKSRVGAVLANLSGRRFVDLDARVEAALGRTIGEIFAESGESVFREAERRELEELLADTGPALVVALGGGTLEQAACRGALDAAHARVAWLELSPSECARRLGSGARDRPLLSGAGAGGVEAVLERLLERRSAAYSRMSLRVSAAGSPEDVAGRLQAAWT